MRSLLLSLLLAACAGSQPAANSARTAQAAQAASFDEHTRERWKREEEQRQIEQRRNSFTSNSAQRGDVQPTW